MTDTLPDIFTSLSKYHTIEDHYNLLASIQSDIPQSELRSRSSNPHLFGTARRYLLIRNRVVIRDRLIDFIHSEGSFNASVRMVMYFLFMFLDARCRHFICNNVADSAGKWNTSVFRAHHTSFFSGAGGHKAFTNLRQLMFRTGILDEKTYRVNMGDIERWLPTALEIAAEHLLAKSRAKLIASPHGFLIRNKLNALVNLTPDELAGFSLGGTYEESPDLLPEIEVGPNNLIPGAFRIWDRQPPAKRQARKYDFSTDSIAIERAHHQHWLLERLMANAFSGANVKIMTNQLVDMLIEAKSEAILLEMKSCNQLSMRSQVRRAISQLLEYRFLHRKDLPTKTHLCVVLERRPRGGADWLINYLDSLNIGMIWKSDTDEQLISTLRMHSLLKRFGATNQIKLGK